MVLIIIFTIIFSIASTATVTLLGDRSLISGNLLNPNKFISIVIHWRFILAVGAAFVARYAFMIVNNSVLKNPLLAPNSTNVTVLITSVNFLLLLLANYIFLNEKITMQQSLGAVFIMFGTWIILR